MYTRPDWRSKILIPFPRGRVGGFLSRLSQEGVVQRMSHLPVHDVAPHVQTVLCSSPISELRELRIEQRDGLLLIFGTVSSFYHKQLAQEAVRVICQECRERDLEVVNRISVRCQNQESGSRPELDRL